MCPRKCGARVPMLSIRAPSASDALSSAIRYAVRMWPYLTDLGYTHVMRMDDDSYLHSAVPYNLFDFMRRHHKRYAFRQPVVDNNVGLGFFDLLRQHLDEMGTVGKATREKFWENPNFGFYTNWFMADMSFFLTPPVSTVLDLIDKSKLMYTQRTGDLIIQSAMVRLFLSPVEVHWFRDFTYEHTTLGGRTQCPQNGGISRGRGRHSDTDWAGIVDSFKSRFRLNPKCAKMNLIVGDDFVGAKDVGLCSTLDGVCGPFLKDILSGVDQANNAAFAVRASTDSDGRSAAATAGAVETAAPYSGPFDAALAWARGTALKHMPCDDVRKVAEWKLCWPPVQASIDAGACLVYSFGISKRDPFTEFMAQAGCTVFAFDPAVSHPMEWMPNVTFHRWGLRTGLSNPAEETNFSHVHWGSTKDGKYFTLPEIQRKLGHSEATEVTVMKIDCEGCEWHLFSTLSSGVLQNINQVLTELHFTKSLRFTLEKAITMAPRMSAALAHFGFFHFDVNLGARYDREVDPQFTRAGFTEPCCREVGMMRLPTRATRHP
jgi:hypothetical protein